MSIIDLFKSGFFGEIFTFRTPLLSIAAIACAVLCAFVQWRLLVIPGKKEGSLRPYGLAGAAIAAMVLVDFAKLFFNNDTSVTRAVFGVVVFVTFLTKSSCWSYSDTV